MLPDTPPKDVAAAMKARWVCEPAHQQLKEELGLDHCEGHSWAGLHRHVLMTLIAFAFLQHQRLSVAAWGKKGHRTTASAEPADRAAGHRRSSHAGPPTASALPAWPTRDHAATPHT